MKSDYDYTLTGRAVRALLAAPAKARRRAGDFLETLASDPLRAADFHETAPSGRVYSVFVEGDLIITAWFDHSAQELRVVFVEFV